VKLSRVGIYDRFAFGGFGCDHENRVELIRCGAQRGAELFGRSPRDCRTVVIGDTPKDVAAAQGIGAESIGVGTGQFSAADLLASGATFAFPDLSHPGRWTRCLRTKAQPRRGPGRQSEMIPLPIDERIPEIVSTAKRVANLLLEAPPGAGRPPVFLARFWRAA